MMKLRLANAKIQQDIGHLRAANIAVSHSSAGTCIPPSMKDVASVRTPVGSPQSQRSVVPTIAGSPSAIDTANFDDFSPVPNLPTENDLNQNARPDQSANHAPVIPGLASHFGSQPDNNNPHFIGPGTPTKSPWFCRPSMSAAEDRGRRSAYRNSSLPGAPVRNQWFGS